MVAAGANILASLLAIAVLKPWRKKVIAAQVAGADRKASDDFDPTRPPPAGAFFFSAPTGMPEASRICWPSPYDLRVRRGPKQIIVSITDT